MGDGWQSQLPGGGNNIPAGYLKKLGLIGKHDESAPEDDDLSRFIREEL